MASAEARETTLGRRVRAFRTNQPSRGSSPSWQSFEGATPIQGPRVCASDWRPLFSDEGPSSFPASAPSTLQQELTAHVLSIPFDRTCPVHQPNGTALHPPRGTAPRAGGSAS